MTTESTCTTLKERMAPGEMPGEAPVFHKINLRMNMHPNNELRTEK